MLYKFRQMITKLYIKVNRGYVVSGTLTNNNYVQSCEYASATFSERHHRFFNIGGTITIFITLFTTLTVLIINYFILYYQNFSDFPAKVSSLSLQVTLAIFLGLTLGQTFSTIFSTSVDALLFGFLRQKLGREGISER